MQYDQPPIELRTRRRSYKRRFFPKRQAFDILVDLNEYISQLWTLHIDLGMRMHAFVVDDPSLDQNRLFLIDLFVGLAGFDELGRVRPPRRGRPA